MEISYQGFRESQGAFLPDPKVFYRLQSPVEGGKQARRLREGGQNPLTGVLGVLELEHAGGTPTAGRGSRGANELQLGQLGHRREGIGILPLDTGRSLSGRRVLEQGRSGAGDVEVSLGEQVTNFSERERVVEVGGGDEHRLPPREGIADLGQTVLEAELVHLIDKLNVLCQSPNANVGAADGDGGTNDGISSSAHLFIC